MELIKLFFSMLIGCFILDMTWLGLIAKKLYNDSIGILLRKSDGILSPNWPATAVVYIAIIAGIILFVLPKTNGSYLSALLWGGIFGGIMYGVYDFTNLAILNNWSIKITLIDFFWGIFLCAIVAALGVFVQGKLH